MNLVPASGQAQSTDECRSLLLLKGGPGQCTGGAATPHTLSAPAAPPPPPAPGSASACQSSLALSRTQCSSRQREHAVSLIGQGLARGLRAVPTDSLATGPQSWTACAGRAWAQQHCRGTGVQAPPRGTRSTRRPLLCRQGWGTPAGHPRAGPVCPPGDMKSHRRGGAAANLCHFQFPYNSVLDLSVYGTSTGSATHPQFTLTHDLHSQPHS